MCISDVFSQVKAPDMEVIQARVALEEVTGAVEVRVPIKDCLVYHLAPTCSQGHLGVTEVTAPSPMQVALVVVDSRSKLLIG